MKRPMSGMAVGLSLALLLSLTAAAQEPSAGVLEALDPTGDVMAIAGPMHVEGITVTERGPDYVDITMLRLEIEGSDLIVTFEVAGDIPEQDPDVDESYYSVHLQRDDQTSLQVMARESTGWSVEITEVRPPPSPPGEPTVTSGMHGKAERSGNRLVLRVPLRRLGNTQGLRFLAMSSAVRDCSPADGCGVLAPPSSDIPFVWWQDEVPHAIGDWLTFATESLAQSPSPSVPPSLEPASD